MRLILALTILTLAVSTTSAFTKDWRQMNGHERRSRVVSYIHENELQCTNPSMSISQQEESLAQTPWFLVMVGLKTYCVQTHLRQIATRERKPEPVIRAQPHDTTLAFDSTYAQDTIFDANTDVSKNELTSPKSQERSAYNDRCR